MILNIISACRNLYSAWLKVSKVDDSFPFSYMPTEEKTENFYTLLVS